MADPTEAVWSEAQVMVDELVSKTQNAEKVVHLTTNKSATFGKADNSDYKNTFFSKNPRLKTKVIVHHAVEQQVSKRYH
ncbi:hypothetical protein [Celerinatantimonas sp. YJH-8]|uniref:hypothetical protein n=1 Tax=Celerinatantimonas sp. YJH-8 TaxID=3228714 RepID=UPI0038C0F655